jgi:hypothetical protein
MQRDGSSQTNENILSRRQNNSAQHNIIPPALCKQPAWLYILAFVRISNTHFTKSNSIYKQVGCRDKC